MIELTQEEIESVLARKRCPSSPGDVLQDMLDDTNISIQDLVKDSDITVEQITSIIDNNLYITEELASKLDALFYDEDYQIDRSIWRVLQLKCDLWRANND